MARAIWITLIAASLAFCACATPRIGANDPPATQGKNPITGTWTLDVTKSRLQQPAPKSEILRLDVEGAIATADFDEIAANGQHISSNTSLHLNGKTYKVNSPSLYGADSISGEQPNANTTQATLRRRGAVVAKIQATVSRDGKTATITVNTSEHGKDSNRITLWNRCTKGAACGAEGG